MHRAGTSWLGLMLAAGRDFIEITEPLNPLNRQTILPARVSTWYAYIDEETESPYLPSYEDALSFRPHPLDDIRRARLGSPRDPVRIPKRWGSYALGRMQRRRLLIRDPFALVSLRWFLRRLGCAAAVVIVRHPLAVVSSLKRLGFTFDFRNLLTQDELMRDHLALYREEMESHLGSGDVTAQGALLWTILYGLTQKAAQGNKGVIVVRHEDLSLDPLGGFEHLYRRLGLEFDSGVMDTIERYTGSMNAKENPVGKHFTVRLDSKANLGNWRHRLEEEDVARILETTSPIREHYYPDEAALLAVPDVSATS